MNNSINTPRLTSALQLIEQAAAVLVAVSLSAEEMDAADVVDAIKACSSLVIRTLSQQKLPGGLAQQLPVTSYLPLRPCFITIGLVGKCKIMETC